MSTRPQSGSLMKEGSQAQSSSEVMTAPPACAGQTFGIQNHRHVCAT